jgi:hypothetical protein
VSTRAATAPAVARGNDLFSGPVSRVVLGGLGTGDGTVRLGPGSVPVVLPGRWPRLPLTGPARRGPRARWPGRLTLAAARRAARTAGRRPGPRARQSHQGRRRLAACPETRPRPAPDDRLAPTGCCAAAAAASRSRSCGGWPVRARAVRRSFMSDCASPVWACPAPGALWLPRGLGSDGLPWASRELSAWPGRVSRWVASVPCGQPLVPTGPQSPVRIFSNYVVLAGAPLRNRTIDLLLTMHACFVRRSRGLSGCHRQEGYRRLGPSRSVCCCLDP